jgi:erythromycin esterase-like protein
VTERPSSARAHGTRSSTAPRAAITRRFIERHGLTIVGVEADWPDAAKVDAYVRHRPVAPMEDDAFTRFPTWMWRNEAGHHCSVQ